MFKLSRETSTPYGDIKDTTTPTQDKKSLKIPKR